MLRSGYTPRSSPTEEQTPASWPAYVLWNSATLHIEQEMSIAVMLVLFSVMLETRRWPDCESNARRCCCLLRLLKNQLPWCTAEAPTYEHIFLLQSSVCMRLSVVDSSIHTPGLSHSLELVMSTNMRRRPVNVSESVCSDVWRRLAYCDASRESACSHFDSESSDRALSSLTVAVDFWRDVSDVVNPMP